ncbi:MAG: hypothetical protein IBX61_04195 [Thermoleophilia bacterium]|nr:hypothetical protein [Thermoleophilia bacterium]
MEAGRNENSEPKPIEIDFPEEPVPHLKIGVGACRLRIRPGEAGGRWVSGIYEDPTGGMPYKVTREGGTVRLTQKQGLATLKSPFAGIPVMDIALGKDKPYSLAIESGASDTVADLGGLPINMLLLKKGAGKAAFDFSGPNPAEMEKLDVDAGAVALTIRNLANANFKEMTLNGGAASYELDFSGGLKRPAQARINAGASTVKLSIPGTTAARIRPGSVIGALEIGDGLMKKEGAFWTEAALAGKEPVLDLNASIALGKLVLEVI